jgi:hypothetical protein
MPLQHTAGEGTAPLESAAPLGDTQSDTQRTPTSSPGQRPGPATAAARRRCCNNDTQAQRCAPRPSWPRSGRGAPARARNRCSCCVAPCARPPAGSRRAAAPARAGALAAAAALLLAAVLGRVVHDDPGALQHLPGRGAAAGRRASLAGGAARGRAQRRGGAGPSKGRKCALQPLAARRAARCRRRKWGGPGAPWCPCPPRR